MKLIGLLITIALLSFLFIWWMNLNVRSTQKAMETTQSVDAGQEVYQGKGPIDYSKEKAEEINEETQKRADEYNQLP